MEHFDQLFADYARRAWGLAYALTGRAADADDVVQQAWVVVWQRQSELVPPVWPWLAAVVANCARNFRRAEARLNVRVQSFAALQTPAQAPPETEAAAAEQRRHVLGALAELPEHEQEAVVMCHIGGLTQEQASQSLGLNLNTLKARVRRGMEHLRSRLQADGRALELMLPVVLWPEPTGGWDAATARWKSQAVGSSAAATASSATLAKLLMLLVGIGGLSLGLWLVFQSESMPETDPGLLGRATPLIEDAVPLTAAASPVAVSPADMPPPAAVSGGPERPSHRAALPDLPPETRVVVGEPVASGRGVTRLVTVYYDEGPVWKEWYEHTENGVATLEGPYTEYWPDGSVQETGQFRRNRRQGPWIRRHANGELHSQQEWQDHLAHGYGQIYHENGVRHAEGTYVAGKKHGYWQYWHDNGNRMRTETYIEGKLEGEATEYDTEGRRVRLTHWKDHRRHGTMTEFDSDGNVVATREYVNGEAVP